MADPFLAVGVISAPEYVHRRMVLRSTWLGLPAHLEASVSTTFVVRAGHAPTKLQRQLASEVAQYHDLLRVESVFWNETRLRGPVLTLAAWLQHAAAHISGARFVAKVDDDSYLHAPDLAAMLKPLVPSLPHAHVYMGTLTWYSWFAEQWDRCGFGWTWRGSENVGHLCRNSTWASARCGPRGCGPSVGPFPFAAGYLIVLSLPLVTEIATSADLGDETRRLASAASLVTHKGFKHTQIFEDVWLGSFVHRFVASRPIAWVQLFRSETVVDLDQTQWGSTVRPSALLVHSAPRASDGFSWLLMAFDGPLVASDGMHAGASRAGSLLSACCVLPFSPRSSLQGEPHLRRHARLPHLVAGAGLPPPADAPHVLRGLRGLRRARGRECAPRVRAVVRRTRRRLLPHGDGPAACRRGRCRCRWRIACFGRTRRTAGAGAGRHVAAQAGEPRRHLGA